MIVLYCRNSLISLITHNKNIKFCIILLQCVGFCCFFLDFLISLSLSSSLPLIHSLKIHPHSLTSSFISAQTTSESTLKAKESFATRLKESKRTKFYAGI